MSGDNAGAGLDSPARAGERGLGHRIAPQDFRRNAAITRTPTRTPASRGAKTTAPRKRAAKPAAESVAIMPGTPRKKAAIAGPKRKKGEAKPAPEFLDRLQAVIVTTLEDDKAEDIVTLDLAGRASFADRMIIATGIADRQIAAMATHLYEKLAEAGFRKPLTEGATGTDWVLIDAGDIVVHLFKPEARTLYGLEKMWSAELDEADSEA